MMQKIDTIPMKQIAFLLLAISAITKLGAQEQLGSINDTTTNGGGIVNRT